MYGFASRVLTPLIWNPLGIAVLLLVLAKVVRERLSKVFQIAYGAALLLLIILGCPRVEEWLTSSLESQYADQSIERYPEGQAIVVLGGAIHSPNLVHRASGLIDPSDRLLLAFRLYRAGKAPLLILSGGNDPETGEVAAQSEATTMRLLLEEWGIQKASILAEERSTNTHENALFCRQLLAPRGISRILLVTSALHLPRAAAAFRKAGFEVVPAPADFRMGWSRQASLFGWLPDADALANSSRSLREWLGGTIYRLRGWA